MIYEFQPRFILSTDAPTVTEQYTVDFNIDYRIDNTVYPRKLMGGWVCDEIITMIIHSPPLIPSVDDVLFSPIVT